MISASLRSRIITAVLLAPLAVAAILLLDTLWLMAGLVLLVALAAREWARFVWPGAQTLLRVLYPLVLALGALGLGWLLLQGVVWPVLLVGALWWLLALAWLFAGNPESTPGGVWVKAAAGVFVLLPAMHGLAWLHGLSPWWLLALMLMIWSADVGAYFAGKQWGRSKLAPRISPGKTWAGVWGGLALAAGLSLIVASLLFADWMMVAGLVLLVVPVVLFSVVGDLTESLMKRQAQMKDSGRLLPGHGGIMDRFDSLFAAAPVFALGVWLLL